MSSRYSNGNHARVDPMSYSISTNNPTPIQNTSARCTINQLAHTLPKVARSLGQLLCRNCSFTSTQDQSIALEKGIGTHQLRPITDWLLDDHGLSLSAQNEFKKQLVLRSRALGYSKENPLFVFSNNRVQTATISLQEGDPLIAKPLDDAKLVLADLYQKKYGIRIVIETCPLNKKQLANKIKQECLQAKGKPVGLILQTTELGQVKGTGPAEGNYCGHVTPIVVQQRGKLINVISLDSVLKPNSALIKAMLRLSHQNINVRMITLNSARQADHYSCHTDALQILKDLLTQNENSSESILDDLSARYLTETDQTTSAINLLKIDLPPFLQKVNQRAESLGACGHERIQAGKCQTVEQHWQRYSRHPWENSGKLQNYFLAVKAFHNANKVLNRLESFDNEHARQDYLANLRNTYT